MLTLASLALSLLSSHIGNRFAVGSSTRAFFLGLGALFLILTFYFIYADRWNKFKSERTDKGAEAFLFFNRIGEGFYSVMIALARFISAGTGYFLKKKSRIEKNQQLILERMQEMNDENRSTSNRIETKLDSLSSDLADNAAMLAAIREDNDAALSRHLEREEQLKAEIADLKDRIESLQASGVSPQAEEIIQLKDDLEETKASLSDEQAHIDRLEEKKESLEKGELAERTFKDLLISRAAKEKAETLEQMAREIIEASKGLSKKYQSGLAKFYRALVDCGYLCDNESAFISFFYNDYGRSRGITWDSYRRSFNNAVTGLSCLEYTKNKEEIRGIVLG
ncbi:MAG: hypothetical protein IKS22_06330 [Bacteroidales bacterium]|nr:hypothetical protein [Bacteroidales bacterium]